MCVPAARLSLTNFFMRKICHIQNACPIWKAFIIHETSWLIVYIRYILGKWEVIVLIAMLRLYEIKNDCLFFWTKVYPLINVPSYCFISSFCIWYVFFNPESVILELAPDFPYFCNIKYFMNVKKEKTCHLERKRNKEYYYEKQRIKVFFKIKSYQKWIY